MISLATFLLLTERLTVRIRRYDRTEVEISLNIFALVITNAEKRRDNSKKKAAKRLATSFFKNAVKRSDITLISVELPNAGSDYLSFPLFGISAAAISVISAIFESNSKKFSIGDISRARDEHTNLKFDLMLSIPLISAVFAFILAALSTVSSAMKGGILNDGK